MYIKYILSNSLDVTYNIVIFHKYHSVILHDSNLKNNLFSLHIFIYIHEHLHTLFFLFFSKFSLFVTYLDLRDGKHIIHSGKKVK